MTFVLLCVCVCSLPGQCSGPDPAGGVSALVGGPAAGVGGREPAEQREGPHGARGAGGPGRAGGGAAQRPEGGAVSHLLPAPPDVHRRSQHRQASALPGNDPPADQETGVFSTPFPTAARSLRRFRLDRRLLVFHNRSTEKKNIPENLYGPSKYIPINTDSNPEWLYWNANRMSGG